MSEPNQIEEKTRSYFYLANILLGFSIFLWGFVLYLWKVMPRKIAVWEQRGIEFTLLQEILATLSDWLLHTPFPLILIFIISSVILFFWIYQFSKKDFII